MYLLMVVALMGALPILSVVADVSLHGGADVAFVVARWFVFWSVGVRLLTAGLRQAANPAFTGQTLFRISDLASLKIVRELGFANLAIGVLGVVALFEPDWVIPAALAGGLFYGLAGVQHAMNKGRERLADIAMVSDLFVFLVLAACLVALFLRHLSG
jgi:hypothetical protein